MPHPVLRPDGLLTGVHSSRSCIPMVKSAGQQWKHEVSVLRVFQLPQPSKPRKIEIFSNTAT